MAAAYLDDLDRRIVGALQVNGRASWRRIADALGESFSTVTRRGNALISSGAVRVATLPLGMSTHVVYLDCLPGDIDDVASSLAADHRAVFVYRLGGSPSIVAEITAPESELAQFTRDIADAHAAIRSVHVAPVLRYFQTVAGWRPPVLTDAEVQALDLDAPPENVGPSGEFDEPDATIVRALARDGRIALTTIAEEAGIPESTARRRVDHLFTTGRLHTRIVIEPASLGLPVEALLWIQANPAVTVEVGEMLAKLPSVRYAALVMGRDALVVNITMSSFTELAQLLTGSDWVPRVSAVHSELVLASYKRSGVLTR
ncbi:Lrp/AsnC family transcriptional regulator [Gordonia sp. CPCC 205515]|uniref:Lrp/AsnC family transcriptional regulator n=1 Tax=Gordonia sp. CPCC 205515 TaxID=3140791 RepID=UPI003AF3B623